MKLLVIAGVGVAALSFGFVVAANQPGTWVRTGDPTLQKTLEMRSGVTPDRSNRNCTPITTRIFGMSGMQQDCVASSAMGLVGYSGIAINGFAEEIPVEPYGAYIGLLPVPHQGMFITYSSSPAMGLTMNFYQSILDKIKPIPDLVNGRVQFTLAKGPDFMLRDGNGHPLNVNPDTVTFSDNGAWMVADVPYQGFIRVNLASFEILPFAPSVNFTTDANVSAQLAISNDGRYAAIKPDTSSELRVYDLASCNGSVMPVNPWAQKCQSRDYQPYIASQITTLRSIYHPRFMNGDQLSVAVTYDYQKAGVFKAAQYTLTAPGVSPTGIEYLGMGDSFASGQGAFDYLTGTDTAGNTCHLSVNSYPMLLSSDLFFGGHSVACSGAETKDIKGNGSNYIGQNEPGTKRADLENTGLLPAILQNYTPGYLLQSEFVDTYNPQAITLSIGGNDIGFTDIVTQCVSSVVHGTCYASYEDQAELLDRINGMVGTLADTYRTVSAPGRRVYIIGYPQIVVAGGNCAANVHLNDAEIRMFINLTDALNAAIAQAASNAGVMYVDVSDAFQGHRMCETNSSDVAVNGLTAGNDSGKLGMKFIGNESYHPNALGHQLLEQAILRKTSNLKLGPAPVFPALVTLPVPDAPKTGRPLQTVVNDSGLVPDVVSTGATAPLATNPSTAILRPGTTFTARLDASPQVMATAVADAAGTVNAPLALPASVPCGYHVIHLAGENIIGQPIDVSKLVFVESPAGDCTAADSPCGIIPPANADNDKDGIDDACDPFIGNPPLYKAYLRGSSIHAVKQQ